MRRQDGWELAGIVALVAAVALARTRLPARVELGDVVLGAAALILVQGLARDLARLRARTVGPAQRVTCVCAESTVGVGAIAAGVLLVFGAAPIVLHVPGLAWPIGVALVTVLGFATRHLVLDWRERRLRWEPDHGGTVVWKR